MRRVVLYGSPECHLCEQAHQKLMRVRRVVPFELDVVDVKRDPGLNERYGNVIPVVAVDGRDALVSKVTEFRLLKALLRERPLCRSERSEESLGLRPTGPGDPSLALRMTTTADPASSHQ